MQPVILQRDQIILAGMSFYGDPFESHAGWEEENQIGLLWQRFMGYLSRHGGDIQNMAQPDVAYEVHITSEETYAKGLFEVFVGVEIANAECTPFDLSVKVLPASEYVVFTLQGEEITADWEMLIDRWMNDSGYRTAHAYNFQLYDRRFRGMDNLAESILDVYVPIIKITKS